MKYFTTIGLLLLLPQLISAQLALQITSTNVSCFGGNNGGALATPSGGTQPYTYLWSNGLAADAIAGLAMGTYTVTVTDNSGSTASKSINITQPPFLGATLNGQPQICTIAPDGFAYAIPTGGTPPYSYAWSNGVHTQLNNYLTANNYSITITDTRGCTALGSYAVGSLDLGLYLLGHTEPATCPQPYEGSASVSALSGNGPYQYIWNTGAMSPDLNNLTAGNYEVTVSDMNGCSATHSVTVEQENLDPSFIQVSTPQCTGTLYDYEATGGYHMYNWILNDPRDSIIGQNDGRKIQIKWGAQGQKELVANIIDTLTNCSTSLQFNVTVYVCSVSTKAPELAQIQVGPNPFKEYIRVEAGELNGTQAKFQVYNVQGKLVAQQSLPEGDSLVDTQGLAAGVYFVKLSNEQMVKTWKMVKN